MNREAGFTIIELIIVIVIIGILLTVTAFTQVGILSGARDSERADDTSSIARLLEDAYTNQTVGAPAYPSIETFTADIASGSGTTARFDSGIFRAPNASSSSVIGASSASTPTGTDPSLNQYVYQPLTSTGALCKTSSQTCVLYRLYYRQESNNKVVTLSSAHQQ